MLKRGCSRVQSNEIGLASISIKVPGTFSGNDISKPTFQGRFVSVGKIWFSTSHSGDKITAASVKDLDGVITEPYRAAFPNYPVISDMLDRGLPVEQQGYLLEPNTATLISRENTTSIPIPAGLYIVIDCKKGQDIQDYLNANVLWDDSL